MTKKIAVIIHDRQAEAFRMAIGLILVDDTVDVYVLDKKLEPTEQAEQDLELMQEMEMKGYTNTQSNSQLQYLPTEKIAQQLTGYDHVLVY